MPRAWRGRRVLLHFGAVDWESTVWVNGSEAGTHRGGYRPVHATTSPTLLKRRREAGDRRCASGTRPTRTTAASPAASRS
ncbi:MAG: hypothetical protein M0C28_39050 [Candidatus Moduliflexus flocculans]|nr:hypothetical protein [Candidatus Moduliflexus flocculans]